VSYRQACKLSMPDIIIVVVVIISSIIIIIIKRRGVANLNGEFPGDVTCTSNT